LLRKMMMKMENKYTFETENEYEMKLVVSRHRMLATLKEFKDWRRDLYKGYDNNLNYFCNGKIYTIKKFRNADDIPRDEHGIVKGCKTIYYDQYIIDKIDDLLFEVRDLLD